jgi:hypothetical protein
MAGMARPVMAGPGLAGRGLAGAARLPIEVWLSQRNLLITCRVVNEDESTEEWPADSLSMRGAQREMTGLHTKKGFTPVGRWETVYDDGNGASETMRRFKPAVSPD